jgi:hypothetical protein
LSGTKEYQKEVKGKLIGLFEGLVGEDDIGTEWIPFGKEDSRSKYSPRIDVAVGPFAYGDRRLGMVYDELSDNSSRFIIALYGTFRENAEGFSFKSEIPDTIMRVNRVNPNARCLISIEIERSGSRKHRLGDIVNACSLGRVGVVVAWDDSVLRSFLRITEYLRFLRSRDKPSYSTGNLVILTKSQFDRLLPTQ